MARQANSAVMSMNAVDLEHKKGILHFFLNLFRMQTGASAREPGVYRLWEGKKTDRDQIFELSVKRGGKWVHRRMTLGPLGEQSGSKSKCYKVIFDDVLVVKIPPGPITDFKTYISLLEAERRIQQQLEPDIQCITPTVSSILRRIPPFTAEVNTDLESFEKKCIRKLEAYPSFQEFLKIGGSFVFFMNLLKHAFLSNLLEELHDHRETTSREVMNQTDVLWDLVVFAERHGDEYIDLFYALNDLFSDFERIARQILTSHGVYGEKPTYQIKEWYLLYLSGNRLFPHEEGGGLPPEFAVELNESATDLMVKNSKTVGGFRRMISRYVRRKTITQNRIRISLIISNTLDLLSRLKGKGIAVRDLKPDNVFVIDGTEVSTTVLNPEVYRLGLIDFETAVRFQNANGDLLEQPMLAGTPSYATPSHLFPNDVILDVFHDLPRIFHLQDWQAVIGMIYNVVTGERLVEKTGRLMPEIMTAIKRSVAEQRPQSEVFKASSRLFWERAMEEFGDKVQRNREKLRTIEVVIPARTIPVFQAELVSERKILVSKCRRRIGEQRFFKSPKSRQELFTATSAVIRKCRMNWESGKTVPNLSPPVRRKVIELMQDLENLKGRLDRNRKILQVLERDIPRLPVDILLETMFNIVLNAMYLREWDVSISAVPGGAKAAAGQTADGETAGLSTREAEVVEKTLVAARDEATLASTSTTPT